MKNNTITRVTFGAATVFSGGVLAGCSYCQLLLASVIALAAALWLPSANPDKPFNNYAY